MGINKEKIIKSALMLIGMGIGYKLGLASAKERHLEKPIEDAPFIFKRKEK